MPVWSSFASRPAADWSASANSAAADPVQRAEVALRAERSFERRMELFGHATVHVATPPPWLVDVNSDLAWDPAPAGVIDTLDLSRASDVKVVWELSRLRHCVAMAQGLALGGHPRLGEAVATDLADWRCVNPVGGSVNWSSPMEIALRSVNLVCTERLLAAGGGSHQARKTIDTMLVEHGAYLVANIEPEPRNNHYLAQAAGLIWLGSRLGGRLGHRCRRAGVGMAREAIDEQVLEDGLGFEGSLPYHALALELGLLARVAAPRALRALDPALSAMLDALVAIRAPGGVVPNIGDDDGGRASALCDAPSRDGRRVLNLGAALLGHADAALAGHGGPVDDALWLLGPQRSASLEALMKQGCPPDKPVHFAAGGIVVLGDGEDHVVIDVGSVGTRGRGGHGHLDAMSFEATLGGVPVVRDSGTGTYTRDLALREELRGLEAHSVVSLDGLGYAALGGAGGIWSIEGDSVPRVLEVGGRVGGQAMVATQTIPSENGPAHHVRRLAWRPGRLRCEDRISAPPGARVRHVLQVGADVVLDGEGARGSGVAYRVERPYGSSLAIEPARWSQRYGSVQPGRRLVIECVAPAGDVEISWRMNRT